MPTQDPDPSNPTKAETTPQSTEPEETEGMHLADSDIDDIDDNDGDGGDNNSWALSFADEPWQDYDPEADDPDTADEPLSFDHASLDLENVSSFEYWLQSALKALVEPKLSVDGVLGRRSRIATKRFQARAHILGGGPKLDTDGIAGDSTIAALEALTGSQAPKRSPSAPARPNATQTAKLGTVTVREREHKGKHIYEVSSAGDTVSFSYWTKSHRGYKPHCVSRYRGAKRDIIDDQTILDAGYSTSELGILRANSQKESGGTFGAINTWDNQIISWGMAQFAGHAGTLAALLVFLRELPSTAESYKQWFTANGLDVQYGPYPWKDRTKKGWHVVVQDGAKLLRGDDGWRYVRTQPNLLGAFMLAGNDPAIALGQVLFWRQAFLKRALHKIVGRKKGVRPGSRVIDFLTAERSLALMVRLYNWMPAYVRRWSNQFLAELATSEPASKVYNPAKWDQALETWWAERVMKERRDVKKGSYDDYALELSRERGSFVLGRYDS